MSLFYLLYSPLSLTFFKFAPICCILFFYCFLLCFSFFCVCLFSMLVPSSSPLLDLQPALCRRIRSMSLCVPPSSYSFHAPSPTVVPPKKPSTPPPDLSSPSSCTTTSPCMSLAVERDTFAGRLSKALETVLPLQSTSSVPRARQRRASLPALSSTLVGSEC